LVNWEKAITTAVSLQIQQDPLATPEDNTPIVSQPPPITRLQQNAYIAQLSQQLQKPLPQLTDPLPSEVDVASLPSLLTLVPTDPTLYQNALDWMNQQMQQSHQDLQQALQGIPPTVEGFDEIAPSTAPVCKELVQCLAANPEVAAQLAQQNAQAQDAQKAQTSASQQEELLQRILPFLQNSQLLQAGQTNQTLAKQSDNIQQQAQSGELYQQLNLPKEPDVPTVLPQGAFSLQQMQQYNPQQYNQLKDNYKQWFDMKQLIEQINKSL
jgi:hypothetical protein